MPLSPVEYQVGFRTDFPAGFYGDFHRHDGVEIVYHLCGSGENRVQGLAAPLRFAPGTVVIYPAGSVHDQRMFTSGTDYGVILAPRGGPPAWPCAPTVIARLHDAYAIGELTMLSAPVSIMSPRQKDVVDWRGMALLAALRAESSAAAEDRDTDPGLRYVQDAQRYMSEHLALPLKLRDVAGGVGLSAEYLRHLFVKCGGKPLGRWLTEMRVRRAMDLLVHSPLPIKAIATQCGFRNERYFCTAFRKETGITPGTCRRGVGALHPEQYLDTLHMAQVTKATYEQQARNLGRRMTSATR
jgi:AraC-like DNA-binding protein